MADLQNRREHRFSHSGISFDAAKSSMRTGVGHIASHNIGGNVGGDVIVNYYNQQDGRPTCKEVVDWLRSQSMSYRRTHDDTYSARTSNTGGWLFNCPQFKDWEEGKVKHLACIGMPGAGKTSLASAVIERLQGASDSGSEVTGEGPSPQPRRLVLYIYCKHNSQSMQTLPIIFANLLSQIVQKLRDEELSGDILKLYEDYKSERGMPRLDLIVDVLRKEISKFGPGRTYIIFDALDEYQSGGHLELVKAFESLDAQLFFTSRWEVPFTPQTFCEVADVRAKEDDIRTYIDSQLQTSRISRIIQKDPTLLAEIVSKLNAKAKGMFLLPKLHMQMMECQRTPQGIRDTMERLPEDLHSLFREALQRILDQPYQADVDLGIRTLKWMRYAKKFLSTDELLHALAMYSLPEMRGDPVGFLPLKEDVLSACAGLVVIVEPEEGRSEFRFTHYSIQEFLERPDCSLTYFGLSADREITESCLRYLINTTSLVPEDVQNYLITTPLPPGSGRPGEEYESYRKKNLFDAFPLSTYAGCYWGDHAAAIEEDFDRHLVSTFFRQPLSPYMYSQLYRSEEYVGPLPSMDPEHYQLLFLSLFGLGTLLSAFLESSCTGTAANGLDTIQDSDGWTAPCFAALHGYADAIHRLLDKGASIDIPDHDGNTPLCRAAEKGHFDVVKLLVEKGALVNPSNPRETPLCWAASGGCENIVRFLLAQGADVNPAIHHTDEKCRTPLHAATENNNSEIAELLLDRGAAPNPPGVYGGEPLAWAALHGNQDLVQLLLNKGANIDQLSDDVTPLHLAIQKKQFDVAGLLIDRGAAPNPPGVNGGAPLAWAAFHGSRDVVKLLLEKGADLSQTGLDNKTPLQLAILLKHFDTAELLLARGAAPNSGSPGANYGELLAWAIKHGNRHLVQLLLDKGADPNQADVNDNQPLPLAIWQKHFDIADLLLARGAAPNPPGPYCGEPLGWAVLHGNRGLVQLLLDKGADLNQANIHDKTPLHLAIQENHSDVAELLLGKDAVPNASGKYCGEPLAWAACYGNRGLVQLLLDKGAEVNQPDETDETPLTVAIRNEHIYVVQLLLGRGARCKDEEEEMLAKRLTSSSSHACDIDANAANPPYIPTDSDALAQCDFVADPVLCSTRDTVTETSNPFQGVKTGEADAEPTQQGEHTHQDVADDEDGRMSETRAQASDMLLQHTGADDDSVRPTRLLSFSYILYCLCFLVTECLRALNIY